MYLKTCTVPTWLVPIVLVVFAAATTPPVTLAQDSIKSETEETRAIIKELPIWPKLAPLETSQSRGVLQPHRQGENPPVTRVEKIRLPTMDVFLPAKPSGAALLILPGGGFGKVVPDKEGSEAAPWLNRLGIAAMVLRYRTNEARASGEPSWRRPLQDTQRALRLIRARAESWKIQPEKVGVLGFSAGGQVAAVLHGWQQSAAYAALDNIDKLDFAPAYSLMLYPWQVLSADGELLAPIQMTKESRPAFLVHTDDDRSSSLGAVQIYSALKRNGVESELHIYRNGGHGYGMRAVRGSAIGSWPDRATEWLRGRGLTNEPAQ